MAATNGKARPVADITEEAARLLGLASERSVELYLLGGVAISLRRPANRPPLLPREPKDIDFFVRSRERTSTSELLEGAGYEPDWSFNALNGRRRLLFRDESHDRQVDVFIDEFEMCHRLPIAEGLEAGQSTISLSDLLATKLQIYELNAKDQIDILNLLHDHPIVDGTGRAGIDKRRLGHLCAQDWAFWRTSKLNFERSQQALEDLEIEPSVKAALEKSLGELWRAIESEAKPRKWRMRNRIGDRLQWYDLPEELG